MVARRLTGPAAGVAVLYGLSVGLLMLSDLALANTQTRKNFGEYQFVRQLVPLLTLVSLAGIDQALTRHAAQTKDMTMFRPATHRALRVSVTAGLVAAPFTFYAFKLSGPALLVMIVTPSLLVLSEMCAALLRSRGSYITASAIQQGYRLILAVTALLLSLVGLRSGAAPLALLALAGFCGAVAGLVICLPRAPQSKNTTPRDLRIMGYGFGVSMLAVAGMDWVDQATLSLRFDSISSSGDYAALKLILAYPFIALSSIVGFLAMPEVAKRSRQVHRSHFWKATASLALLGSTVAVPAWLLVSQFAPLIVNRSISAPAAAALCVAGVLRLTYVVPSIFFGAIGSARLIFTVSTFSLLSIPISAAAIILIPTDDVILAGAIGLLLSGAFRLAVALYGANKSFAALRPLIPAQDVL